MKLIILLLASLSLPVYAGNPHHDHSPPEPTPINVPDDGSNHNALAIGIALFAITACVYSKCWKPKPVKAEAGITPEVPKNEYTYQIKP